MRTSAAIDRVSRVGLLMGVALFGGCSTPATPVATYPRAASYVEVSARTTLLSTNPISLAEAVEYALETNPRLRLLADRCDRELGELAGATTLASPEARFGFGRARQTEVGASSQTESGSSLQTGSETTIGASHQTGSETTVGTSLDSGGETTITSVSETDESRSSFQQSGISRSSSTFSQSSQSQAQGVADEDEYAVSLRWSPPNPWELRAAGRVQSAAQAAVKAELLAEEYALAYDIHDLAIQIGYYQSMVRVCNAFLERTRVIRDRAKDGTLAGDAPQEYYADACRLVSSAQADGHKLTFHCAELLQAFHALTGVDPQRVVFTESRPGSIYPMTVLSNTIPESFPALALSHPDALLAKWGAARARHERDAARARRAPWISHMAGGYASWKGNQSSSETFNTSDESADRTSGSSSAQEESTTTSYKEDQRTSFTPFGVESETGSHSGNESEWQTQSQSSSGTQYETGSSSGSESSYQSTDGDEWWVEVGVSIPIFEWFSSESSVRRRHAVSAGDAIERAQERLIRGMSFAHEALISSRRALMVSEAEFDKQEPELKTLAAHYRKQGVLGEVDALRIEAGVLDMFLWRLEGRMAVALGELRLCRATGTTPK